MGLKITPAEGTTMKFAGTELAECFAIVDLITMVGENKKQKIELTYFQSETARENGQKSFPASPQIERDGGQGVLPMECIWLDLTPAEQTVAKAHEIAKTELWTKVSAEIIL